MEELGIFGKIALTGLIVFAVGFILMIIHCTLGMEDLIDYEVKWPKWISIGLMSTGAITMIASLIAYIWV